MNRRCPLFLAFTLSLLLWGCASSYKEFYTPAKGATPEVIAATRLSPAPANPIVERSQPGDPQKIVDAYLKRGYSMIGNSMFYGGEPESENDAVRQGQKVGADLVLILNPQYLGSTSSTVPVTSPSTTTSYSTGSATAYGRGGPVTAYGSGTTTTRGSTTTYIPMTTHWVEYGALYFVKRRFVIGLSAEDLSDSERQALQSNKGAAVRVVVDGSPAFEADILVGDIITAIDGVGVLGSKAYGDLIGERRGRLISLSIVRRGQRIEKSVQLNP